MQKRQLGRSGIEIAPLILGGNVFGWTADQATSFAILDAFVDAGFNCIDTADVYATWIGKGGVSEETIGAWLKASGKRDKVVICTKVGAPMAEDKKGLSATYINAAVEASLKRLGTDRIDLYQAHRDDPDTPQEETMAAFDTLVETGKVRAVGCSNFAPGRIESANAIAARFGGARFETEQPLYNLMERQVVEPGLQRVAERDHVSLIPYFGLAAGFLTGKYRSEADLAKSSRGGGVKKYLNDKGFGVLAALDEVAGRHGATQAQVALAWQLAKPFVTAPIASATSVGQLREILAAVELSLSDEDMVELNTASA